MAYECSIRDTEWKLLRMSTLLSLLLLGLTMSILSATHRSVWSAPSSEVQCYIDSHSVPVPHLLDLRNNPCLRSGLYKHGLLYILMVSYQRVGIFEKG